MLSMFGKKTVASVMTAFNTTIADLQQVEAEHTAEAERKRIEAEQATAEAQAALKEAAHAREVSAGLINIVSMKSGERDLGAIERSAK